MKYTLLPRKHLLKEERYKICWILGKKITQYKIQVMERWKKKWAEESGTDKGGLFIADYRVWKLGDNEDTFKNLIKKELMKEDVVFIYNGILCSHQKKWNLAICDDVDGTGGYFA